MADPSSVMHQALEGFRDIKIHFAKRIRAINEGCGESSQALDNELIEYRAAFSRLEMLQRACIINPECAEVFAVKAGLLSAHLKAGRYAELEAELRRIPNGALELYKSDNHCVRPKDRQTKPTLVLIKSFP